jgi:hypothetical protein
VVKPPIQSYVPALKSCWQPVALYLQLHKVAAEMAQFAGHIARDPPRSTALLVIAHPDDEAMFFGPMLISTINEMSWHILCLSTGTRCYQPLRVDFLPARTRTEPISNQSLSATVSARNYADSEMQGMLKV